MPFGLVVAITLVVSILLIVFVRDRGRPDSLRRSQLGASIADSLGAYIQSHRTCPTSLQEIGITQPAADSQTLHYRAWDGGTKCEVTAGDYGLQGFEEYWRYPPGDWYVYKE